MKENEFTPTDDQVRTGYAVDPEAEYRDPLTNHTRLGEAAFDRWLKVHDQRVRATALREAADEFGSGYWADRIRKIDVQERLRGMVLGENGSKADAQKGVSA